jgi:glutathionyl-hydroquinone reductase
MLKRNTCFRFLFTQTSFLFNKMTTPEFKQRWISAKPDSEFPPEPNRYELAGSTGCPFHSRVTSVRALLGLEKTVFFAPTAPFAELTAPDAKEGELYYKHDGYVFDKKYDPVTPSIVSEEPTFGAYSIREIYEKGHPLGIETCRRDYADFLVESTVPVLIDTKKKQVVSAESADIVKMFWENREALGMPAEAKEHIAKNNIDLFPAEGSDAAKEVEAHSEWIHNGIVFGVYGVGYTDSQASYEKNQRALFEALDKLEALLDTRRFIAGNTLTFVDLSLIQCLVRFDIAYVPAYRVTYKRIRDYKNIYAYACDVFDLLRMRNGFAYVPEHIVASYFGHRTVERKERFVPLVPADSNFVIAGGHGRDTRKY